MKVTLSGKDWVVSPFLPNEAGGHYKHIKKVVAGNMYGGSFIPATVPGDVQSDAMDAGLIGDVNVGYNAMQAEWTHGRDWMYVRRFTPETVDCKKILLCFDGVDYECDIFLNGEWIASHEIAWIPFKLDVTDKIKVGEENCLIVLVKAAPYEQSQGGSCHQVHTLKARFAYGWDFCTRLVPLGIWRDVYVEYRQEAAIDNVHIDPDVDYAAKKAVIHTNITLTDDVKNCPVKVTLTHPCGKKETVNATINGKTATVDFTVENAQLWWPNGYGAQPLYNVEVVLADNWDRFNGNCGLRHIDWIRVEGAGENAMSYVPVVNGRRVYMQGFNWTPIRQLYGRENKTAYNKRLGLFQRSGANFLRVWGGGILEREYFYDLCDKAGILVLQELFQSSASMNNHPPREGRYMDLILAATESAVVQKRNHPSLTIWCGGNELCFRGDYMDAEGNILKENIEDMEGRTYDVHDLIWIPLSPKDPTRAAMEKVVRRLDPKKKWLHTSGSGPIIQNADLRYLGGAMHDVHGPWEVFGPDDFYHMYNVYDMMAHTEFGCPSSASVQTLETIVPEQYRWPLDANNPMANYHGRLWVVTTGSMAKLERNFGKIDNYKDYALTTRFAQWEQLRYALEAHRRLGKKFAAASLWAFGEPWANVNECCSVDAYDQAKPAYYGEKAAFRPLHIAPKYASSVYEKEIGLEFTLYNTNVNPVAGEIRVASYNLKGEKLESFTGKVSAEADAVVPGAMDVKLTKLGGMIFVRWELAVDGAVADTGWTVFGDTYAPYEPLVHQEECAISGKLCGNQLTLKNNGKVVASAVTLETDNDTHAYFSDGCMMLLPGEEVTVDVEFVDGQVPLYISGFGVSYQKLGV